MFSIATRRTICWFWLLWLPAIAAAQIGEVSALRGAGGVLRQGEYLNLGVGDPVLRGDTVRVATRPADSQMEIRLSDGSLMRIDAGADLALVDFAPQEPEAVMDLIQGHVWLEVQRGFSRRRNAFRVRTRHGIAGVQGTRFGIDSRAERTLFKVFEGSVAVLSRYGAVLRVLTDNESLVLDSNGVVSEP